MKPFPTFAVSTLASLLGGTPPRLLRIFPLPMRTTNPSWCAGAVGRCPVRGVLRCLEAGVDAVKVITFLGCLIPPLGGRAGGGGPFWQWRFLACDSVLSALLFSLGHSRSEGGFKDVFVQEFGSICFVKVLHGQAYFSRKKRTRRTRGRADVCIMGSISFIWTQVTMTHT